MAKKNGKKTTVEVKLAKPTQRLMNKTRSHIVHLIGDQRGQTVADRIERMLTASARKELLTATKAERAKAAQKRIADRANKIRQRIAQLEKQLSK